MPTTQENCGIAALVFTTIAFVIIIVIVAQNFVGGGINGLGPREWCTLAAVSSIALGLLLTEIGLVVPYSESYKSNDEDDKKSEN